jgi:Zn-dependent M28 family amino/carboxypeptidase
MGYLPIHTGYQVGDRRHANLEVALEGAALADEIVVIGAHYDTYDLTPGADDNASGVAAVLELARMMALGQPDRTVRFVFFGTEEPPYFNTENMGSRAYATDAAAVGENLHVMISMETIGFFVDEPGSQHYPPPFSLFYPDRGDFIGIVGNPHSGRLTRRALQVFRETTPLPSEGATPSSLVPGAELSDHSSFWREGFRAMVITDTAPFRNPHYHRTTDTPETLDFERMARVVIGTREIVRDLAGDSSTAARISGDPAR